MATNEVLVKSGTAILWGGPDYSSIVSGLTKTHDLDLDGVVAGAARQGAKADLGATRAKQFAVMVAIEFLSAAISGEEVEFWWAGSPSATAGNANPGGTTGADADYTGTAGDSLADSIVQLDFIGALPTTSDNTTVVQYKNIGILDASSIPRYGMPVVYLNTTPAAVADAVEMYFALIPIIDDIQAAA